jgi:hypothetical protein
MEEKEIRLSFKKEEAVFVTLMERICKDRGISAEEYIKDLIKKDLAWGHFKRPRKSDSTDREGPGRRRFPT